jgi:hypothetical protein
MSLTRLKNIITSRTGRIIYVNPDDFDATDSIDNRGNSALRPFKSLQRAFLEVARFSYRVGLSNDEFDAFSIYLYPSEYIIDNRPGEFDYTQIAPLDSNSNFDITNPSNILYKFNSVEGGVIVPRGCSIIGSDLRRTKIVPKYVPYPTTKSSIGVTSENEPKSSAIFRVTGGCYCWQFTIFDGDGTGVYYLPEDPRTIQPNFSHHKLTTFEFADGRNTLGYLASPDGGSRLTIPSGVGDPNLSDRTDLELYYQKISRAYASIPDTSGAPVQDQLQARVEENRIVGPISDEFRVLSINRNGQTATAITVDEDDTPVNHGFSVGISINISGVIGSTGPQSELDASLYNGSFQVTSAQGSLFTYQMSAEPSGNAIGTNILAKVEIDTVDSSSPYIFNCSLRSVWGLNGMNADGFRTTGFKSMVVAQFTGLSLQKDDRAFVRYNTVTKNYEDGGSGSHLDGACRYKKGWRHCHIKAANDAFIQVVSVFAVAYGDHFFADSGADMSITNSNSNFGSTALRCRGFKAAAFTKDKAGTFTHIIPPKSLDVVTTTATGTSGQTTITVASNNGIVSGMAVSGTGIGTGATVSGISGTTITLSVANSSSVSGYITFGTEISINWVNIDIKRTKHVGALGGASGSGARLYLYGYTNTASAPPVKAQGYQLGARWDSIQSLPDKLYCLLQTSTGNVLKEARISPSNDTGIVTSTIANATNSPIKYDSTVYNISGLGSVVGGWYIQCTSGVTNTIYTELNTSTIYSSINFTPSSFIKRIPDARTLKDRIYRFRYVVPKGSKPIPREPLTGYVIQPRQGTATDYNKVYYVYEIEKIQSFISDVQDGIYYITLLCASIAPSTSNYSDYRFSQNVNEVYPSFDRDNPNADPTATISVADNVIIGSVYGTSDGTIIDAKKSITKEAAQFFLAETSNALGYSSILNKLGTTTVTAGAGDSEARKIPLKLQGSTVVDLLIELRRHSIQRSGNHTFEYVGFGPGNYSTAFPQTQIEVLTFEQVKYAQCLKEAAGVSFYSGLNSNGDLFIGNQVINPVTGQITSSDIAQLNIVGEEGTTIQTFSELVLTDKLTVIGGDSNSLESLFSGPVTFQGKVTSDKEIQAKKLTYSNSDGTVLKSSLIATSDTSGNPVIPAYYTTPSNGDIIWNISWDPTNTSNNYGRNLGWMYYGTTWYQFGLTNSKVLDLRPLAGSADSLGTTVNVGIGVAPSASYKLNVGGALNITGSLTTTGTYGLSARYASQNYTGNGATTSFALTASTSHGNNSVLVFLNGILQVPGTHYNVSGTNVVFTGSHIPSARDAIHIRELPL